MTLTWPLLSKFELNQFLSLQVTVPESNQPPHFLQRWKKVNFMCWLNTTFCVEKPYYKPRPSLINIIGTLLRRMEWFRNGLPNFAAIVHNRPKTHWCDHFGAKFGIFEPQSQRVFASICDDRWNVDPPLYSGITWRVKTVR